jgi:hypothetical protein
VQGIEQRLALRLAHCAALLGRLLVDRRLDRVELANAAQGLLGDRRLGAVVDLEQLAPRMGHAGDMRDLRRLAALRRGQRVVAGVGIGVQPACIAGQVLPWPLALAVRRVVVDRRRRAGAAPRPGVEGIHPEPADARSAAPRGEDADGGVVGPDHALR